jgi:hypothetical protein
MTGMKVETDNSYLGMKFRFGIIAPSGRPWWPNIREYVESLMEVMSKEYKRLYNSA